MHSLPLPAGPVPPNRSPLYGQGTRLRPVRRATLAATLLAAPLLLACGGGDAPPADAQAATAPMAAVPAAPVTGAGVIGTIEATVDGEAMTWYVVTGTVGGGAYSSGVWVGEEGERQVVAGGFDTDDPPLDTFETNASGLAASYGSYDGSVMAFFVTEAAGTAPVTLTFPEAEGTAGVYFQRRASLDDMVNSVLWLSEGTLELSRFSFEGGAARVEGTFSGTFTSMGTGGTVRVTDGRFAVGDIPSSDIMGR